MNRTVPILVAISGLDAASLLAVLTPVVVVPMAVITFYLRALRDHLTAGRGDLTRRIEHLEAGLRRLESALADLGRDHVTKEDWLRESMLARSNIERLTTTLVRMEAASDARDDHARQPCGTCGASDAGAPVRPRHDAGYEGAD